MTPSEQITALCDELGIERPTNFKTLLAFDGLEYQISDLLKWDGWLRDDVSLARESSSHLGFVEYTATSINEYGKGKSITDTDPRTAIQLLAVARLEEIKREREG